MHENYFQTNFQVQDFIIMSEIRLIEGEWKWYFPLSFNLSWKHFCGKLKFCQTDANQFFLPGKLEKHVEQFAEYWLGLDWDWWWSVRLH